MKMNNCRILANWLLWIDDRQKLDRRVTREEPRGVDDPTLVFCSIDFDFEPFVVCTASNRFYRVTIRQESKGGECFAGAAAHVQCLGVNIAGDRDLEVSNSQFIEVDMDIGYIKRLHKKAHFSSGIIGIRSLADQLIIDMKEKIRTLSIHALCIIIIEIVDAFISPFRQHRQRAR